MKTEAHNLLRIARDLIIRLVVHIIKQVSRKQRGSWFVLHIVHRHTVHKYLALKVLYISNSCFYMKCVWEWKHDMIDFHWLSNNCHRWSTSWSCNKEPNRYTVKESDILRPSYNFHKSRNGLSVHSGPENIEYTLMKYGETFYVHHTALTPDEFYCAMPIVAFALSCRWACIIHYINT